MNAETKSDYLYLREDVHQPLRKPGMSLSDCRKQTISWYKGLDPEQTILHTMLTGQIFGLLGVTSYHQIQSIIENPELRQTASNRLMRQLTKLYGLKNRKLCEKNAKLTVVMLMLSGTIYNGSCHTKEVLVWKWLMKSEPIMILLIYYFCL